MVVEKAYIGFEDGDSFIAQVYVKDESKSYYAVAVLVELFDGAHVVLSHSDEDIIKKTCADDEALSRIVVINSENEKIQYKNVNVNSEAVMAYLEDKPGCICEMGLSDDDSLYMALETEYGFGLAAAYALLEAASSVILYEDDKLEEDEEIFTNAIERVNDFEGEEVEDLIDLIFLEE